MQSPQKTYVLIQVWKNEINSWSTTWACTLHPMIVHSCENALSIKYVNTFTTVKVLIHIHFMQAPQSTISLFNTNIERKEMQEPRIVKQIPINKLNFNTNTIVATCYLRYTIQYCDIMIIQRNRKIQLVRQWYFVLSNWKI